MIRNVVVHLNGEQALVADIYEAPSPGDVGLRCTNLRLKNGKRPVFVDDMRSIFFFPYLNIRFVEIPPGAIRGGDPSLALTVDGDYLDGAAAELAEPEPDLEIDEDFLRRIREV
jgi:hypothetical protein